MGTCARDPTIYFMNPLPKSYFGQEVSTALTMIPQARLYVLNLSYI